LIGDTLWPMSKVTGKFQITLPKRLVTTFGIRVGDEVDIFAAGDGIVLQPARRKRPSLSRRLREFDLATERQREREHAHPFEAARERGWTREELYTRDRPR
jgi:AbrB family looped-hinge helix DNA binding protein